MEKIKADQNQGVISERQEDQEKEKKVFIESIKRAVAETFPFDSQKQEGLFLNKLKGLIDNSGNLSEEDLIFEVKLILASLENTHTKLEKKDEEGYFLERLIFRKANKFWLENKNKIQEVVSLDGVAMADLVEEKIKEIGGGTREYRISLALEDLLESKIARMVAVGIKDGNQLFDLKTAFIEKRALARSRTSNDFVESRMLDQEIGYLRIRSWSRGLNFNGENVADLAEDGLKTLKTARALIVDVRENSGGDDSLAARLAGHFIKKSEFYGSVIRKLPKTKELIKQDLFFHPRGEFLGKKTAVLIGPKCISSNEAFIMMMKTSKNVVTVGQVTGGGSGCPRTFELILGGKRYDLKVSTWKKIQKNGRFLENIGIEPDVSIKTTPEDVVKRQDVELERAKDILRLRELENFRSSVKN